MHHASRRFHSPVRRAVLRTGLAAYCPSHGHHLPEHKATRFKETGVFIACALITLAFSGTLNAPHMAAWHCTEASVSGHGGRRHRDRGLLSKADHAESFVGGCEQPHIRYYQVGTKVKACHCLTGICLALSCFGAQGNSAK